MRRGGTRRGSKIASKSFVSRYVVSGLPEWCLPRAARNRIQSRACRGDSPLVSEISVLVPRERDNDDVQGRDEQQPY